MDTFRNLTIKAQVDIGNLFGGVYDNPDNIPGGSAADTILIYARNAVVLALVIIGLAAVVTVLLAALKVITSGGAQEEIEGGFTGIKNAFVGLAITFVVLIAILYIINIFIGNSITL